MSKRLLGICGLVVSATLLGLGLGAPGSATAESTGAARLSPQSPIEHVVIIYQENHSFDDVLGAVCEARPTPCNGYTGPVTFRDGKTAANIVQPDIIPEASHTPKAQRHGLHNKWDLVGACTEPPYPCVSHSDPANIPNLAALADTYAVSDATFAGGNASSFVAHVSLGGGSYEGFVGANPVHSKTGEQPGRGWGCPSNLDALWGAVGDRSYEPTCIPDRQGNGPYRASRVPYAPTIMQRMEQKGLTWHMYEGETNDTPMIGPWSVCTYFAWCYRHRFQSQYDSKRTDFVASAANGTLPNLSFLIPTQQTPIGGVSQHNGSSMRLGDDYIGQMVSAVMNGPDWDSTAIFITYDDCGCFYDHVRPPKGLGLRNPMVIVSPWVKPGFTDSTTAVQPYSALAFTQHVFGLRNLTTEVTHAYDYADAFDFSQQPLPGIEMVNRPVPRWELPRLAALAPQVMNDPS